MNTETTTMINSAMQYAPDILDVASDLLDEAIDKINSGDIS